MLRIILDTNVLMDADKGSFSFPAKIMQEVIDGKIDGFTSHKIRKENSLIKRELLRNTDALAMFDDYVDATEDVRPTQYFDAVQTDPEDNKFIDAAVEAHADYIVTSDKDLLDIREFEGVKMVKPQEFWNIYQRHQDPEGSGAWQSWFGEIAQ